MNREAVLFHLQEAVEQLNATIKDLSGDPEYGYAELRIDMGHLYHHLNTAWNGRDQTDAQFRECTDEDFERFRKFPRNDEFLFE